MEYEPPISLPRAMLFDMDGTLTEPMLDFPLIKAEMGIGTKPILEALATLPPRDRAHAEEILHRHEAAASASSRLNPGCGELLDHLAQLYMPLAIITRNSARSAQAVLEKHQIEVNFVLAREDAPPKPSPEALHVACERLGVREAEVWMVGDGQYDVEAGLAAGVRTVWLSHGRPCDFDARPWKTVSSLHELIHLLQRCRHPSHVVRV